MKIHSIILASLALATPAAAGAQELQGSVIVQGDYLPTLRTHTRISPQPSVPQLTLPQSGLSVASAGVPTQVEPLFSPMRASGWQSDKAFSRRRGYLVLGGGSYFNFIGSAGYRFIDSDKATLGAWLQHTSSSGFKPYDNLPYITDYVSAKLFDERLGIYGSYNFDHVGTADFDLRYRLGYFNYYTPETQTLNDLSVRIGFASPRKDEGLTWDAAIADRYFGYRRFHHVSRPLGIPLISLWYYDFRPSRENDLGLSGSVAYGFGSGMKAGVALDADYVSYSKTENIDDFGPQRVVGTPSAYGRVALTPAFRYADDKFGARLGARLDITTDVGKAGESMVTVDKEFGNLHVAPDVSLSYRNGKAAAELTATGGVELRTLAATSELTIYQLPQIATTLPWFSPLNARLGLTLGSFSGFSARAAVAYKITDNTLPDMIYPALLHGTCHLGDYMPLDIKGWSLQAGVSYKYGEVVKIDADMSYQPQNGATGYFNGADRPRWIIDARASVNPWSTLNVGIGYEYRGVRNVWMRKSVEGMTDMLTEVTHGLRLNDVANLSLGADYTFGGRYGVWLKADNLLGNNFDITAGMPSQGFSLMGGVSILF